MEDNDSKFGTTPKSFKGIDLVPLVNLQDGTLPEGSSMSPFRLFTHKIVTIGSCGVKDEVTNISDQEYNQEKILSNTDPTHISKAFKSKFTFNLHWYLCEEVWERHQVSLNDVLIFIKKADVLMLWFLGMTENFPITTSASKPSFYRRECIIASGKTVIQKKISEFVKKRYAFYSKRSDKLICRGDKHTPTLPVHEFDDSECEKLLKMFDEISRCYKSTYKWKTIEYVPLAIYNKFLQMVRVVKKEDYLKILGAPWCPRVVPTTFMIGDEIYYEMDETFFLYSKSGNHLKFRLSNDLIIEKTSGGKKSLQKKIENIVRPTTMQKTDIFKNKSSTNSCVIQEDSDLQLFHEMKPQIELELEKEQII